MNSPASSVRTLRRCRAPILNIPRATEVSVYVVRAFVHVSEVIASSKDLSRRINQLEAKMDAKFRVVFEAIRELMTPPAREGELTMGWQTFRITDHIEACKVSHELGGSFRSALSAWATEGRGYFLVLQSRGRLDRLLLHAARDQDRRPLRTCS
jgi:hypothetical protein